jgi:hypothetical protein
LTPFSAFEALTFPSRFASLSLNHSQAGEQHLIVSRRAVRLGFCVAPSTVFGASKEIFSSSPRLFLVFPSHRKQSFIFSQSGSGEVKAPKVKPKFGKVQVS